MYNGRAKKNTFPTFTQQFNYDPRVLKESSENKRKYPFPDE